MPASSPREQSDVDGHRRQSEQLVGSRSTSDSTVTGTLPNSTAIPETSNTSNGTHSSSTTPRPKLLSKSSSKNAKKPSSQRTNETPRVKTEDHRSDSPLPLPVTASAVANPKKARINATGKGTLQVHWSRFIRRMNHPGTGSNFSESLLEFGESEASGSYRRQNQRVVSTSAQAGSDDEETKEVNVVVVDNVLMHSGLPGSVTHSDHYTNPEASPGSGTKDTEAHSQATHRDYDGIWGRLPFLRWLRWDLPSLVHTFFSLSFFDPAAEGRYRKESWYASKNLALWSSVFFIVTWALTISALPTPLTLPDKIFYGGVVPLTTFTIPFMVIYDLPRRRRSLYQVAVALLCFQYGFYNILYINFCGFYGNRAHFSCNGKDFVGLFFNVACLPTIGLFALRLTRFAHVISSILQFIFMTALLLPHKHTWFRNLLIYLIFQLFIIYIHFKLETAERRLYGLRDQLKVQFTATQKAQVLERKAADSKRRMTSYIFHEVRVPLNTALLAVQNMEATGAFDGKPELQIEFAALGGSLSMMSKVLNDVLDFNRLDAGRFESVSRPYNLHTVLQSMLVPLRSASQARGLTLVTELDPQIDEIAKRALYVAQALPHEKIEANLEHPTPENKDDAIVVGDEMRLRQIVTNLTSNATKFTQEGGTIKVITKLLYPKLPIKSLDHVSTTDRHQDSGADTKDLNLTPDLEKQPVPLSMNELYAHNLMDANFENIVVRIEVHDTGVGIRAKDLEDKKLFSPYVQTEIGRYQGGKGTGLGLALIRRIVKLSGGRLGVKSKPGVGSMFWVELSLGVGRRALAESGTVKGIPDKRNSPRASYIFDGGKAFQAFERPSTPHPGFDVLPGSVEPMSEVSPSAPQTPSVSMHTPSINDVNPVITPANVQALKSIMEQRGPLQLTGPPKPRGITPPAEPVGNADMATRPSSPEAQPSNPPSSPSPSPSQARSPHIADSLISLNTPPSVAPPDKPTRCLIVDDDALTRKLMSRMLQRLGCTVETASNGQIALEMIVTDCPTTTDNEIIYKYDVVFLDNQMPVMSGLETVSQLREAGRQDFVVGVTGNAMLSDQQEYIEAGVNHVLAKPVLERSVKAMLSLAHEHSQKLTPLPFGN